MLEQPDTWATAALDDLTLFALGGDWGKAPDFDAAGYVDVFCIRGSEIRDWDDEKGATAALRRVKKGSLASRRLVTDDILVEISGGGPNQPVGRTVLVDQAVLYNQPEIPKICTNFFRLIRPAKNINSSFLNTFLKYFYNTGEINRYQGGSNNLRNLKFNDFLTIPAPVPPLKEQERIVAKIEELFSELDKGIESLKTAREQLKVYREAVLKHAFEGKLTAKWREENSGKLEPPEQLLARIKKEREGRYQQQLADWEAAVKTWNVEGGTGGKPTRPLKLKVLQQKKSPSQKVVPRLWTVSNFCNVTYKIGDIDHKMPKESDKGYPYLSTGNLAADGTIDFSGAKIISEQDYRNLSQKIKPEKGDIIFPRYGTIGRNCLVDDDREFLVSYSCAIVKNIVSLMNEKYVYYFSLSPWTKSEIRRHVKETTQANIGIASIEQFTFPLCSYDEQSKIVETLESQISVINAMEKSIDDALLLSEVCRQSILKNAYSGLLVPQDWNDEPASVLLKRIKAEKAAQLKMSKKSKRK